MLKSKMPIYIEIAYDLLGAVFSTLCRNKEIEQAEKLQDIMRQLYIFSRDIQKKKRQQSIKAETMIALLKLGEQTHEDSRNTTV